MSIVAWFSDGMLVGNVPCRWNSIIISMLRMLQKIHSSYIRTLQMFTYIFIIIIKLAWVHFKLWASQSKKCKTACLSVPVLLQRCIRTRTEFFRISMNQMWAQIWKLVSKECYAKLWQLILIKFNAVLKVTLSVV